jgi:VWFA-related protein
MGGSIYAAPGQQGQSLDRTWLPSARDPGDEAGHAAVVMLRAVRDWATWLAGVSTRRKTLVLFTEGVTEDTSDVLRSAHASLIEAALDEVVEAARASHVAVYTIDPRGLPGKVPKGAIPSFVIPDEPFFSPAAARAKMTSRALASRTGGFAHTDSNDFAGTFDRIVTDSREYYLLGYRPPTAASAPRTRRILVRVARPDVRVVARESWTPAR